MDWSLGEWDSIVLSVIDRMVDYQRGLIMVEEDPCVYINQ